jgi:hypothetical protein
VACKKYQIASGLQNKKRSSGEDLGIKEIALFIFMIA